MPTPFVLPQGYMQVPPHYAYKQVGIRGFPLKAQKGKLEDLVNRCLNDNLHGTGYSYKPIPTITQYYPVHLMVSTYGSMVSLKAPFSDWGWMSQTEVIFTIPLLRYKGNHPEGTAFYTPFSFVDNAWSMITGNMILGFQKGLASFQLPPGVSQPYPTEIKTPVFPRFSPPTPLSWEVWIRIEKKMSTNLTREPRGLWPFGPVDDLFGEEKEFEVTEEVRGFLRRTVTSGIAQIVQLLQLRDPAQPDFAAYSKIVKLNESLQGVHGGGLLDFAQIDLRSFDSLPVIDTLDLALENGQLIPVFPYWLEIDFNFEL